MPKILWVVNTVFPDAAMHLKIQPPVYGGWMYGLAKDLSNSKIISLAVASIYTGETPIDFIKNGIHYYLIPNKSHGGDLSNNWKKIIANSSPEVVHIHGTEYSHGMSLMKVYPDLKYIISIQGLVSVYYRYFLAGMSAWDVISNITLRDIARLNTLVHARNEYYKRGLVEKEYISRTPAVIGRTEWDYAHAKAINSGVDYYFCNESLRDDFYSSEKWSISNCRRFSIFLSQASYPIKGLHQVLKAIALLKDEFPDILVEVAGHDITKSKSWKDRLSRNGYGKFISKLIKKHLLKEHIKFLGPLQAREMKNAYLRAHVFICPSSIENSPNSLGEAQILGVPSISSYCGGTPSMVKDKDSSIFYRFEEIEMLATHIRSIFVDTDHAMTISKKSIKEATERHDRLINSNKLIGIYETIVKKH